MSHVAEFKLTSETEKKARKPKRIDGKAKEGDEGGKGAPEDTAKYEQKKGTALAYAKAGYCNTRSVKKKSKHGIIRW